MIYKSLIIFKKLVRSDSMEKFDWKKHYEGHGSTRPCEQIPVKVHAR